MNLVNFLKQIDTIAAQYSTDQLLAFIHDIGRVLPEHCREDFLKRLRSIEGETEKESTEEKENEFEFRERYQLIRNHLKIIDSQEIALSSIWNEEYDEWYDDGEEFCYKDDNGISDMLAEACEFVHVCMDREQYKEGFEIGNQLFSMEILYTNEYYDDGELSLEDMVYHELLSCDLKQISLDTAYCAYRAIPLKKRPEVMYEVMVNTNEEEITLEAMMQHGDEELPDFQDFLTLWIPYLGTKTGHEADRLILEAVDLLNNVLAAAEYAEKYVAVHPGLYLNLLENAGDTDANTMVAIGMKAMKIIPKKYIMRSRVALKTAEYVIKTKKNLPFLEKCYFVAYESDTSALNYLRVLLNGYETERKREELQKVFMTFSVYKGGGSYDAPERKGLYSEREENKPDSNMIFLLRFLDGQFADVLAKGLNKSEALGWSGTFMKQGIALYLLYLYEGQRLNKGIAEMAVIVKSAMNFSTKEYQNGLCEYSNTEDLFYELFLKWKSLVPMEADIKTRAIKKITGLLEKRIEGIMSANRRNYYGECAAYLAALGEVQESLGKTDAKQKLMTVYKDKYSRRSAFREEMRNYGWIDVKKK